MNIDATTLEIACEQLHTLKKYAPFRFGGVWHIAVIAGQAKAYRSKSQLMKAAAKTDLQSIAIATL